MECRILLYGRGFKRITILECKNSFVLGAVILVNSPNIVPQRNTPDEQHEQNQTNRSVDQVENNLAAKDRLNVPYPPFDTLVNDRDSPNDFLLNLNKELKQWLTRWYGYENQDMPSSGFYADAMREYRADRRLDTSSKGEVSLQFIGPTRVPSLTPENPLAWGWREVTTGGGCVAVADTTTV